VNEQAYTLKTWTIPFFERARNFDLEDPLAAFRNKFALPDFGNPTVYFTGNSLGLMPLTTRTLINEELDDWAKWGVEGHFHAKRPWFSYHEQFAKPLAKLAGAKPEEVVAMGQLTANLHFLMASFFRPTGKRTKILCEAQAFPSDIYALKSQLRWHGLDPEQNLIALSPRTGEHILRLEDLENTINQHADELALIMIGGVNYLSGQCMPMEEIVKIGHRAGAVVGFDLAHAMGNVPLQLHNWNVDFAAWCSYKYLNAGPGSVAGIFVHEKHVNNPEIKRLEGWWGHTPESRFLMGPDFIPSKTAEAWQLSNAPVLSMAPLIASLQIFEEAGETKRQTKTKKLSDFFFEMLTTARQNGCNIETLSPSEFPHRGCQWSLRVNDKGKDAFNALSKAGVVADWREPDVIRVAPVPLYNNFEDICHFFSVLSHVYSC